MAQSKTSGSGLRLHTSVQTQMEVSELVRTDSEKGSGS